MLRNITGCSLSQTAVAPTNTSGAVVAANPLRKYLAIVNVGTVAVSLNVSGGTAVAGQGIPLGAAGAGGVGGGSFIMESAVCAVNAINGITASGTGSLTVVEGT